ncbi:olfactory receptor 1361-like [Microcaecilia unicolor]|uniref:Olfactory receptor n=1 Tax=Microcaecilia unicolor TaxID=1415580 RepID=A0A6P7XJS1_9AMPH|nr:olfactory receptor 1361-like [Microcaecilia unicolor]
MEAENQTQIKEFILLGISDNPDLWMVHFLLFLILYIVTLLGNISIISLIVTEPQLHTPMYFFLSNLSLVDMCFTSVTVPKMLINLITRKKTIFFSSCIAQMFFLNSCGSTENFLLSVMAYDRYVAICNPLRYTVMMTRNVCVLFAAASWITAFLHSLLYAFIVSQLNFCDINTIHHFFCELPPLLKLSCSDISAIELLLFTEGMAVGLGPFLCIVISYTHIIIAILKIHSKEGKYKVFSTCSSHLIVVNLYFGSVTFTYLRPNSNYSEDKDRVVTVFYAVVAPMLNPFIYSLRNNDIKVTVRKVMHAIKTRQEMKRI